MSTTTPGLAVRAKRLGDFKHSEHVAEWRRREAKRIIRAFHASQTTDSPITAEETHERLERMGIPHIVL